LLLPAGGWRLPYYNQILNEEILLQLIKLVAVKKNWTTSLNKFVMIKFADHQLHHADSLLKLHNH
jgi:hypothetical protein